MTATQMTIENLLCAAILMAQEDKSNEREAAERAARAYAAGLKAYLEATQVGASD